MQLRIKKLHNYLVFPKPNLCDGFLLLWVVYWMQGLVYTEGSAVSQLILAANLGLSIFFTIKLLLSQEPMPFYFKGMSILLLMFSFYGIIPIMEGRTFFIAATGNEVESYNYLKAIYISFLPIAPFYWFARNGYLSLSRLRAWTFIFVISATMTYIKMGLQAIEEMGLYRSDLNERTNNGGYFVLWLLPALFIFRQKLIQFVLLAYVMLLVAASMKRGALLCGAICSAYFMFIVLKQATPQQRKWLLLAIAIFIIAGIVGFLVLMGDNLLLMQRIEDTLDGKTSNRDNLYGEFIEYLFHRQSLLTMIIGNGANSTLEISENYAHNDWLEIGANQGIIGVGIYLFYFITFWKTIKSVLVPYIKAGLILLLLILILRSMFSMSYTAMPYIGAAYLSVFLAHSDDNPTPPEASCQNN